MTCNSACETAFSKIIDFAIDKKVDFVLIAGDSFDNFPSIRKLSESQMQNLGYSGTGCFNDIDMLVCGLSGKGNISPGEGRLLCIGRWQQI